MKVRLLIYFVVNISDLLLHSSSFKQINIECFKSLHPFFYVFKGFIHIDVLLSYDFDDLLQLYSYMKLELLSY